MTKTNCLTCGAETTDLQPARGRKRDYCSRPCKDAQTYLQALMQALEGVEFQSMDKARAMARGLFQVYQGPNNTANAMQRAEATHEEQYTFLGRALSEDEARKLLKGAARRTLNCSDASLRKQAWQVRKSWKAFAADTDAANAFLTAARKRG